MVLRSHKNLPLRGFSWSRCVTITGQIPRELSGLAHLRTLILADNKLEGNDYV